MKKLIAAITVILWLAAVVIIVVAATHHELLTLIPVFADNRPQGRLGWTLTAAMVVLIISLLVHSNGHHIK
ncbi:hypothetical protein [Secundilactobacillus kimchicus]|uniref:Uncharacterized protein n=1 Tax=Secundilactobacillus kimchicus JCM 15530 TaxID=1302272 RepID=A0A0R1HQG4_9LACO|nr:hypothetical protein [Secundilactobacillus kimchicus]KRK47833.1 hypothetical protein FC96_GL002037 [Secundilactobacillus kimchicus JCM 15530]MBT9671575.1 hypothetical protein [Secundilactobacillus kimchicus]